MRTSRELLSRISQIPGTVTVDTSRPNAINKQNRLPSLTPHFSSRMREFAKKKKNQRRGNRGDTCFSALSWTRTFISPNIMNWTLIDRMSDSAAQARATLTMIQRARMRSLCVYNHRVTRVNAQRKLSGRVAKETSIYSYNVYRARVTNIYIHTHTYSYAMIIVTSD